MGAVGRSMNVGLGSLPGPTLCMDVCGSASLVNHAFATLPSCLCPDRLRLKFNFYFEIKTAALGYLFLIEVHPCRSALEGVLRGPSAPGWLRRAAAAEGGSCAAGGSSSGAADALLGMDLGALLQQVMAQRKQAKKDKKKREKQERRRERKKGSGKGKKEKKSEKKRKKEKKHKSRD